MADSILNFGPVAHGEEPVPAAVRVFLEEHLVNVSSGLNNEMTADQLDVALKRMSVIADVNGTLTFDYRANNSDPSLFSLDDFLCDLHERGLSVHVMSGVIADENIYQTGVAKLLCPEQTQISRQDWFHAKPMSTKEFRYFGMVFDDDTSIVDFSKSCKATAIEPCDFDEFLDAWRGMSAEQKDAALEPWVKTYQTLLTMKARFEPSAESERILGQS